MEYELNFRDYLRIIDKRKWVIVAVFVLSLVFTLQYLNSQTPLYEARCTVKIVGAGGTGLSDSSMPGFLIRILASSVSHSMESEANMIKSYAILEKTAWKLNLIKKGQSKEQIDSIVNALRGRVKTVTVQQTNMIDVTVSSSKAEEAMRLANAVTEVYQEETSLDMNKQARRVREFIEQQLANVEGKLLAAESALKNFKMEDGSVVEISAPLQEKLIELEFERAKLLQKYTQEHPKIIEINEEIAGIQKQVSNLSGKSLEFAQIQRDVEVNRKLYSMLKEKFEEARISEAAKIETVAIVNPAIMPRRPVSPDKPRGTFLGSVMGLLLGFILAFVLENLDTSIGTVEDIESIVKLPVLAVIPRVSLGGKKKLDSLKAIFRKENTREDEAKIRLLVHYQPKSSEAEAYKVLRTNLKINPHNKMFVVTSAGPKEGKTTVLANLGLAMAQAGMKTLLVSTDLRKPSLEKSFGIPAEPGFSEVAAKILPWSKALRGINDFLLGKIGMEGALKTRGLDNLYILTAGGSVSNPSEILSSENIKSLAAEFKSNFDVVLFDSPPVLPLSDALLLSSFCDGVILVYEIGRTSRDALIRTKSQLESYGVKISGIVMNQIKPEMNAYSGYRYYSYSKYKYYSNEEKNPK